MSTESKEPLWLDVFEDIGRFTLPIRSPKKYTERTNASPKVIQPTKTEQDSSLVFLITYTMVLARGCLSFLRCISVSWLLAGSCQHNLSERLVSSECCHSRSPAAAVADS